jgi:hypothetical protein
MDNWWFGREVKVRKDLTDDRRVFDDFGFAAAIHVNLDLDAWFCILVSPDVLAGEPETGPPSHPTGCGSKPQKIFEAKGMQLINNEVNCKD